MVLVRSETIFDNDYIPLDVLLPREVTPLVRFVNVPDRFFGGPPLKGLNPPPRSSFAA